MTFLFDKWLKDMYPSRWLSPLRRAWGTWIGSHRRCPCLRSPLLLQPLESRWVPATLTPTTFADGGLGSGSLRDAVLQFNADTGTADDIIQLLPGTYSLTIPNVNGRHETAGLTGDLNLTETSHRWIIQGVGPSTIIDASQLQDRAFQIVNPGTQVVFQDLVIQGGLAQDNGSDGALAGSTVGLGGGILNNGGYLTLDNVVLQNNVAQGGHAPFTTPAGPGYDASGGGLYAVGGSLDISGSRIANNRAAGGQGRGGTVACTTYTFPNCHTNLYSGGEARGAGLYVNGGSLSLASSTITSNQATGGLNAGYPTAGGYGGGLFISSNAATLTVSNSTLSGNTATATNGGGGGGIYNYYGATLTVSNSTLSGNSVSGSAYVYGGGIYNMGTLTVNNSTVSGNSDSWVGGGIENDGTLTLNNSTLSGDSAETAGGISNSGTLTVSNSTLSGNSTEGGGGGGIDNFYGTLTVSNSTLSGNVGGGILNYYAGTLTVSNSTIASNSIGGGISNSGTLTVSNSTLSGNTGNNGGGIDTESFNPVTLMNVSLTANRANSFGGGLYIYSGSPVLHNTLIAGNFRGGTGTTPDDVYGNLDPGGSYNLIGDGTGMTGLSNRVNGNQVGSDHRPINPLLGPLQDNGGPTFTMALLPGSPAIDAGNNAYATEWDQRGAPFRRIVNGIIDIGAFEVQAPAHGPPTRQPLPAPVPVQALALPGDPLLGQAPDLIAGSVPLPGPALPNEPAGPPETVAAAGPAVGVAGGDSPVASFEVALSPPTGPAPAGADVAAFDPWPGDEPVLRATGQNPGP